MSKVAVVYWSGTGNTEAMAGLVAEGARAEGAEAFEPMWDDVEPELPGRRVALFGSYDWADGEWMDLWRERAEAAGVTVADTVIAKDYPDEEASAACKALGAALA